MTDPPSIHQFSNHKCHNATSKKIVLKIFTHDFRNSSTLHRATSRYEDRVWTYGVKTTLTYDFENIYSKYIFQQQLFVELPYKNFVVSG